ncbi:MAG: diguanylate cyclase domain-containing protein, partial [Erysipelotrichaceae bacterium]
ANNSSLLSSTDEEEEIIKEPYVDSITSLYNESLLDEYISFHNETIYRKSIPMTLIHCDIDFFHNYNEFYGEEEANRLLKTVGKTILYTVNDYATKVVRLRNDEFLILLEKIGLEEALTIAGRLLVNMERLALIHEVSPISEIVSMCMAIATAPSAKLEDYHLLMEKAQEALQSIRNTSTKIISVDLSA